VDDEGTQHRGHHVVLDNLFATMNLFHKLMIKGVWATGIVRQTNKNLPIGLYRDANSDIRGSMFI